MNGVGRGDIENKEGRLLSHWRLTMRKEKEATRDEMKMTEKGGYWRL